MLPLPNFAGNYPAGYSPLMLSPLFWFDASDLATLFLSSNSSNSTLAAANGTIGRWGNKGSGLSYLPFNTTAPVRKDNVQGGKTGVQFPSVNHRFRRDSSGLVTGLYNRTWISVFYVDQTTFALPVAQCGGTAAYAYAHCRTTTGRVGLYHSTTNNLLTPAPVSIGYHVIATRVSSGTSALWVDGVYVGTLEMTPTPSGSQTLTIGAPVYVDVTPTAAAGHVLDVVLCNSAYSDAQIITASQGHMARWGIS